MTGTGDMGVSDATVRHVCTCLTGLVLRLHALARNFRATAFKAWREAAGVRGGLSWHGLTISYMLLLSARPRACLSFRLPAQVALVGVSIGESAASTAAAAAKGVTQRSGASSGANKTEFEKYKRD